MRHLSGLTEHLPLGDWVCSLSPMSPGSACVVVWLETSVVRLSSIVRCVRTLFFCHSYLACFHVLAAAKNAAPKVGVEYLFGSLLSVFWGVYPEAELLGYIFRFIFHLFVSARRTALSSDSISLRWTEVLISPYPCQPLLFLVSLIAATLMGMKWWL